MYRIFFSVLLFFPAIAFANPKYCGFSDPQFLNIVHNRYPSFYRGGLGFILDDMKIPVKEKNILIETMIEPRIEKKNLSIFLTHLNIHITTDAGNSLSTRAMNILREGAHYAGSSLSESFELDNEGAIKKIHCKVHFDRHSYLILNLQSEAYISNPIDVMALEYIYEKMP